MTTASRREIVAGKFLTVVTVSIVTVLLSLAIVANVLPTSPSPVLFLIPGFNAVLLFREVLVGEVRPFLENSRRRGYNSFIAGKPDSEREENHGFECVQDH